MTDQITEQSKEHQKQATRTALNGVGGILHRGEDSRTLSTARYIEAEQYQQLIPVLDRAIQNGANMGEVGEAVIPSLQINMTFVNHDNWEDAARKFTEIAERINLESTFLQNVSESQHPSRMTVTERIKRNLANMTTLQVLKALGYSLDFRYPRIPLYRSAPFLEDEIEFTERLLKYVNRAQGGYHYSLRWDYSGRDDWADIEGTALYGQQDNRQFNLH